MVALTVPVTGRNGYDTRTYPSDGRPQGPSGEGAARRKSYNPNFDEYNRPVGRNRYDSSRDTEGGERRSGRIPQTGRRFRGRQPLRERPFAGGASRSVMPRGTVTAKARNRESMPAVGRMAAARAANGVMATASVLTANAVRGTGKGTAANLTELRAAVLTAVDRPTGVVRPVSGPQSAQVQFGELSDFSGAGYRG